jgi:coenzyme PQQ synthesis protein D (PqqD)
VAQSTRPGRPRARTQNLLIRRLDGEVLVYDQDRAKGICLNAFAAEVWERCDGSASADGIAEAMTEAHAEAVDERAVWLALDQLSRSNLLDEPVTLAPAMLGGASRREFLRTLRIGTVAALPVVTSIVVPRAADAQSCRPNGAACTANGQCCSGTCSGGTCQNP